MNHEKERAFHVGEGGKKALTFPKCLLFYVLNLNTQLEKINPRRLETFSDGKTKAQRDSFTCLRSHREQRLASGAELERSSDFRASWVGCLEGKVKISGPQSNMPKSPKNVPEREQEKVA